MSGRYCYSGLVTRVVDGDTVDIVADLGFSVSLKIRCRLSGIDTPETYGVKKDSAEYAEGIKATNHLKELIGGKTVLFKSEKYEKYGRALVIIWALSGSKEPAQLLFENSVNKQMILAGLASEYGGG